MNFIRGLVLSEFLFKKVIIIVALMLAVSACQTVPGSNISVSSEQVINPLTEEEERELLQSISVYRITPQLLHQMAEDKLRDEIEVEQVHARLATNVKGYQYKISSGDVLNISLWGQPEIRSSDQGGITAIVSDSGEIYFPYVGNAQVAGKTISQVRNMLINRLSNYIRNPQLDVAIASYKSKKIYVTGEVAQPGVQPITNTPLTVLDAVNLAGGLTDHALWNEVVLNRDGQKYAIPMRKLLQQGDLAYNYLLQDGDILHIPRNDKYQVMMMGEVVKPQNIPLGRYGTTLTEALGSVGGINEFQADATGVFVIRSGQDQGKSAAFAEPHIADVYQLDMRDATALALGNQFELQAGDIIYVTAVPIARWNRVLNNILPSVNGLNNINRLVN